MIKACADLIACMENFEGARVRRQLEFVLSQVALGRFKHLGQDEEFLG